jgi:hypothetical protein
MLVKLDDPKPRTGIVCTGVAQEDTPDAALASVDTLSDDVVIRLGKIVAPQHDGFRKQHGRQISTGRLTAAVSRHLEPVSPINVHRYRCEASPEGRALGLLFF